MPDQRERLGASAEATPKLLCFPVALQTARLQITPIVDLASLDASARLTHMQSFFRPAGQLLPIVMREIMNLASEAKAASQGSDRREALFFPSEFMHGFYAVSRILFAQAQENMDFAERGAYPEVTAASYRAVQQDRVERGEAKVPFRERFKPEIERMLEEQPNLQRVLNVIALEGLELTENRSLDFFGGAAFAYRLFQHA